MKSDLSLHHLTSVIRCANEMLNQHLAAPFSAEDVYSATEIGGLVDLLLRIDNSRHIVSWAENPEMAEWRTGLEEALQEGVRRSLGTDREQDNPLCLIIYIALEAIDCHFTGSPPTMAGQKYDVAQRLMEDLP